MGADRIGSVRRSWLHTQRGSEPYSTFVETWISHFARELDASQSASLLKANLPASTADSPLLLLMIYILHDRPHTSLLPQFLGFGYIFVYTVMQNVVIVELPAWSFRTRIFLTTASTT